MPAPSPKRPASRRAGPRPGDDFAHWLEAAHAFADVAGAAILPHFRRRLAVENKHTKAGGFDPVTVADKGAERAIRRELKARLPDHGMVGEELGDIAPDATHRWIVDPIDGTRAFILGLPLWGTLIGLLEGTKPILGLMDQPYTRERFWTGEKASFMRDTAGKERRLKTRACRSLADAMLTTTHPDMFKAGEESERFQGLTRSVRMTRYGGDCYGYCLLAAGHVDVIVEAGLKGFDVVALIPIIEKAGGCITTWTGGSAHEGGRIVASGDPALHEIVLKRLSG